MTYNQIQLKELGNIAANYDGKTIKEVLIRYFSILQKIFNKKPRYVSHINTQMHAFGYYKKQLTKEEKKDFLYLLEDYKAKKISISSVKSIIKSWNVKFENQYLINQSYFAPYPDEL